MSKYNKPIPTESQDQQALFRWAAYERAALPELGMLYHIPNEGRRPVVTGVNLRKAGLKKGVPDICLPVARGGYHGLYIELKRVKNGTPVTEDQRAWIDALNRCGYRAMVCRGFESAQEAIIEYLRGGK